jgi:hypothetical protein
MFQVDDRFTRELDTYDDTVIKLEAGTHNWNEGESEGEGDPAIRVRVDRNGAYDPISSSIIPIGYLSRVVEIALAYQGEK